jgi:hypothetical protein
LTRPDLKLESQYPHAVPICSDRSDCPVSTCVPETNTTICCTTTTSQQSVMMWGPCNSYKVKCVNVSKYKPNCIQLIIQLQCTVQASQNRHSTVRHHLRPGISLGCHTTASRQQTNAACPRFTVEISALLCTSFAVYPYLII